MLSKKASRIRRELTAYRCLLGHPRTPRAARWLLVAAVGYLASPVDLIPDFIPLVGHLDDVIVVSVLVLAARRFVPPDVWRECCDRPEP